MVHFQRLTLALLFLIGTLSVAHAQEPSLPAAPAPVSSAPAKPTFILQPPVYEAPKGAPPPSSSREQVCFAVPEGIYTKSNEQIPPDIKGPTESYVHQIVLRVFHEWESHLTVGEKNAWAKGRVIAVRFAIFPDGTYDRPTVTVSSGRPEFDAHVLRAIEVQSAFPPPPAGMQHPIPVCFRLGYNVDGSVMSPGAYDEWQSSPKPAKP